MPDVLVFCLMGTLLLRRLLSDKGVPIVGGKADFFLILFIGWAFITLLLNQAAGNFVGIANINALLMYVLLVYITLMLNPHQAQVDSLVKWLLAAIGIEVLIGLSQHVGGLPMRNFLSASHLRESVYGFTAVFTGDRSEGVNDLMRTMGDNINFAYFMMVGLVLLFFQFAPMCSSSGWE